ncbi:DUF4236 domain-containing protein [Corallococcus llansteffanensis]|uniref:DUF4236 domain-containing protein n=1 Tax=Corallococcus llansteffanensis TaxID=2316731 RepID=A0A3A8PEW5_9BACT|nr:DUF4236 domain-containing protein [Corallococcus llansteffanensis]RKH54863.1 DUF4236 domain-containing protein [Corallococcus llansteffanensis]
MGFRFRRSVKLMPGVRLNVGLRQSSLSVGVKGARLNLSSKGMRTSGSSRARNTTGRSVRQIEAQQRRAEREMLRAHAEHHALKEEQDNVALVNCWREMPTIPADAEYSAALSERPFEGPAPLPPDEAHERQQLRIETDSSVRRERSKGAGVRWLIVGVIFYFVFRTVDNHSRNLFGEASSFIGMLAGVGIVVILTSTWMRETKRIIAQRCEERWPDHWRTVQWAYNTACKEYAAWPERERMRVESLRRVVNGDVDAIEEAVSTCLESLDSPFETQARVEIVDRGQAYVLLDLPEIEDVIPEVKSRALANGSLKEVRRTKHERNTDYVNLVSGLALQLARSGFSAGPTLQSIHIAAYTQRRQKGTGTLRDEYVYEVAFERNAAARWSEATVDPIEVFNAAKCRYDLRDNLELKAITPPDWVNEMSRQADGTG